MTGNKLLLAATRAVAIFYTQLAGGAPAAPPDAGPNK
jgi:hypothetical protein